MMNPLIAIIDQLAGQGTIDVATTGQTVGYIPPAEAEANYYSQFTSSVVMPA